MNHIKEYREKLKITQMQLAEKMNVKQNTISDWERGYRNPSIKKAILLAEVLNTTVEELFK